MASLYASKTSTLFGLACSLSVFYSRFSIVLVCTLWAIKSSPVVLVQGNINCDNLNKDSCAFAISSSDKRCVLEKHIQRIREEQYTCGASEIETYKLKDWIETDTCVKACGLYRSTLEISSDSLLESCFTVKLCSSAMSIAPTSWIFNYFNLTAGEGVYLPKLCEVQGENARRRMAEIKSSEYVAPGPKSSKTYQ